MASGFNFEKVLVTGGAGFIGSHLAEALVAQGCQVTVLDNLTTGRRENIAHLNDQLTFMEGDIRDQDVLHAAIQGCDLVFHEAAIVSVIQTIDDPMESNAVNDQGTLSVLDAARQNGVKRVVLASSCAVYGDEPEVPNQEEMQPCPKSPYAVQKLTNEWYARTYHELYGLETACLRYFNVYGPRQDPSSPYSGVISIFTTRALAGEQPVIYGDGNQYRDFIFVGDIVRANLLAASAPGLNGDVFNIGTGRHVTINALWQMISARVGLDMAPAYQPARSGEILESVASIDRATAVFGYGPEYTFQQGLKLTIEWYRQSLQEK